MALPPGLGTRVHGRRGERLPLLWAPEGYHRRQGLLVQGPRPGYPFPVPSPLRLPSVTAKASLQPCTRQASLPTPSWPWWRQGAVRSSVHQLFTTPTPVALLSLACGKTVMTLLSEYCRLAVLALPL